jgi:hypothetical protein
MKIAESQQHWKKSECGVQDSRRCENIFLHVSDGELAFKPSLGSTSTLRGADGDLGGEVVVTCIRNGGYSF